MAEAAPKRATYEDVLSAPEHMIAEIIDGRLELQSRPAGRHAAVTSALGEELGPPFKRGKGGPGGWLLLDEPELHLGEDILVPDLAGWRRERLPGVGPEAYFVLSPDWICEVLSSTTEKRVLIGRRDPKETRPAISCSKLEESRRKTPPRRGVGAFFRSSSRQTDRRPRRSVFIGGEVARAVG